MFELLNMDTELGLGTLGNVLITSWYGRVLPVSMDLYDSSADRLLEVYPGGISQLLLIRKAADVPTPTMRKRLVHSFERISEQSLATSLIIEGDGFMLATKRAVMTGLSMVLPRSYPLFVCAGIDPAINQLLSLNGVVGTTREELVSALAKLAASSSPYA